MISVVTLARWTLAPATIRFQSQSTLDPAGWESAAITNLFYGMAIGACLIWVLVVGLATYAIYHPHRHDVWKTRVLVIGGGAVIPTIVLTGLLCVSLPILAELHRPAPEGSLTIEVSGVRWWWRVTYLAADGRRIETANEIRIPVQRPVTLKLTSEDVIHAFWIPALGGKVDMIPGRQTELTLHPTRTGTFRGACAEYCGTAHAQMNFDVVVMLPDEFDRWLEQTSRPAARPDQPIAKRGRELFQSVGCGACHTIRGTDANGPVGPDLTHIASRRSLGAGILNNETENLRRWISATHAIKPGVEMPAFDAVDEHELNALITYLDQLR